MQTDLDKWLKELRKGSSKLAMLSLLSKRDMYGYEITRELNSITEGVISLKESNAYPILHTMETEELINSYWKESEAGMPPRKYYSITPQGRGFFDEMQREWQKHNDAMGKVWKYKG
ncbi:PadR family transcriptional regulator [Methanocella sp. MCL-LM]|uniref:PadR family transcriptional regulator n=1 Tax=Methanocella sp. MCL-LM TaxID=3412035 RepID=UPI003C7363B3